jgi:hypothetical protein
MSASLGKNFNTADHDVVKVAVAMQGAKQHDT